MTRNRLGVEGVDALCAALQTNTVCATIKLAGNAATTRAAALAPSHLHSTPHTSHRTPHTSHRTPHTGRERRGVRLRRRATVASSAAERSRLLSHLPRLHLKRLAGSRMRRHPQSSRGGGYMHMCTCVCPCMRRRLKALGETTRLRSDPPALGPM